MKGRNIGNIFSIYACESILTGDGLLAGIGVIGTAAISLATNVIALFL
jgi:hypothetical protein